MEDVKETQKVKGNPMGTQMNPNESFQIKQQNDVIEKMF